MKLIYYIKRFVEMPKIERILLIKGLFVAISFYLIISILPLRSYFRLLKCNPNRSIDEINIEKYKRLVKKSINRIEKLTPWNYACLYKTITAKYLYNYLGMPSEIILELFCDPLIGNYAHASLLVGKSYHFLKTKKEIRKIRF